MNELKIHGTVAKLLEPLKSKHPNLTDKEQKELIDLLLTQTKEL
jgi:hypothetical protein